jgi:phospholipase C
MPLRPRRPSSPLFALPLFLSLAACPRDGEATSAVTTPDAADVDAAPDVLTPPLIPRTQSEAELAVKRSACGFRAGAWPAETIGKEYRLGDDLPFKHVIVIMQENRSFDHYLGRLVAQGYYQAGDFTKGGSGFAHSDQLDGPPPGWSNPDATGKPVYPHPDDEHCYGVNHGWDDMHDHYNEGKLDHFVTNNDPNGQRSFFYEDDTVIPFYYALATNFAVGDRYFASVMTSTWPNRYYLMGATSYGMGGNTFHEQDTKEHPAAHIFASLEAAGRSWKDYTDGPHQVLFYPYWGWRNETLAQHYGDASCDLINDIQNGTLPDVSLVMGDEIGQTSDEGPSALPGIGGAWVEDIIRTLFASKSWKDTVVFITYDENGGLADHVPPVDACPPDDLPPTDKGKALKGAFDKTGFRVPFIVVSPYTRKHFVSHEVYDHTSITRFIEARFGLPALTARDANATVPMEMFDFEHPPYLTPPTIDAHTTVPAEILTTCGQKMSKVGCK